MALVPEDSEVLQYFLNSCALDNIIDTQEDPIFPHPSFDSFTKSSHSTTNNSFHEMETQFLHSGSSSALHETSTKEEDAIVESEEKKERRLARNRESARQSRRRKKQYLELLEEKVSALYVEVLYK